MKKVLLSIVFVGVSLFGITGEDVYKINCASCHAMQGELSPEAKAEMKSMMREATDEERVKLRQQMQERMQNSRKNAPPMLMVSLRLKKMLDGDKEKFVTFVDDYIQNPSQDKGYCMPMAYKRFGVMPPIGKGMNSDERQLVSAWLYDNFKGTWDSSEEAQTCGKGHKGKKKGKCGAGKCGK